MIKKLYNKWLLKRQSKRIFEFLKMSIKILWFYTNDREWIIKSVSDMIKDNKINYLSKEDKKNILINIPGLVDAFHPTNPKPFRRLPLK